MSLLLVGKPRDDTGRYWLLRAVTDDNGNVDYVPLSADEMAQHRAEQREAHEKLMADILNNIEISPDKAGADLS
jgi:hypothetical protein